MAPQPSSQPATAAARPQTWASPGALEKRIFCNRSLNMKSIEAVGFDMDYTLAQYLPETFEQLAYRETCKKLVHDCGYSSEILDFKFDCHYMVRGLVIDKVRGNIVKMDRHKYVKLAFHGFRELSREERLKKYGGKPENFEEPHYAMIDTLFSLGEAYLFMQLMDHRDRRPDLYEGRSPEKVYKELRGAVDMCHRDGTLKRAVAQDPGKYIHEDGSLARAPPAGWPRRLRRGAGGLRSACPVQRTGVRTLPGRPAGPAARLGEEGVPVHQQPVGLCAPLPAPCDSQCLAGESHRCVLESGPAPPSADTNVVMNFLCERRTGEQRNLDWMRRFDVVITGSAKPRFFTKEGDAIFKARRAQCIYLYTYIINENFHMGGRAQVDPLSGALFNTDSGAALSAVDAPGAEQPRRRPKGSGLSLDELARSHHSTPVFQGGSSRLLHDMLGVKSGSQVLYVGGARARLGWQVPGARAGPGGGCRGLRARALRRPHLWRHPALQEAVRVAHHAGARARPRPARLPAAATSPSPSPGPQHPALR